MATYLLDLLYSFTNCMCCFPTNPSLKINTRSFKMLRLLGEGGFSYVYLVQDTSTSELFALKKIRCPFGQESVAQALKEVEAYKLFEGDENIIRSVDYMVDGRDKGRSGGIGGQEDAGQKTVYILLPYYQRGNLQDAINANLVNHTKFPEKRLMVLMLGVARALRSMHQYRVRGDANGVGGGNNENRRKRARKARREAEEEEGGDAERGGMTMGGRRRDGQTQEEVEEEPLMDEHGEVQRSQEGVGEGQLRPYSHRDIKPGMYTMGWWSTIYVLPLRLLRC
jgi:serine/threonine kinase 16